MILGWADVVHPQELSCGSAGGWAPQLQLCQMAGALYGIQSHSARKEGLPSQKQSPAAASQWTGHFVRCIWYGVCHSDRS